jgi:hypothetical protein
MTALRSRDDEQPARTLATLWRTLDPERPLARRP